MRYSKKRKNGVEEEVVPFDRLTRFKVPDESSSPNTPANPKEAKRRTRSSSSNKEVLEEKIAPARNGRSRIYKVVKSEETPSISSTVEEEPRRKTAIKRAKSDNTPIIHASNDNSITKTETKKPPARRASTKRNVVPDKLEAVPVEKKSQVANKHKLDDVKILHAGKRRASKIPAPEEEENEEKLPLSKGTKVNLDAEPLSAKTTRGKKAVSFSPVVQVYVRLKRDPEIEMLAAASIKRDGGTKLAKRCCTRTKQVTTVVEPTARSPAKLTKRPQRKKAEGKPAIL